MRIRRWVQFKYRGRTCTALADSEFAAWIRSRKRQEPFVLVAIFDHQASEDDEWLDEFASLSLDAGVRGLLAAGSAKDEIENAFDFQIVLRNVDENREVEPPVILTMGTDHFTLHGILWDTFNVLSGPGSLTCNLPVVVVIKADDSRLEEFTRMCIQFENLLDTLPT